MNYWIIADTHFGHEKMEELCGRPKGFEAIILSSLLSLSGDTNSVFIHLGDICIGDDEKWNLVLLSRVPCLHKWLVRGNHDKKSMSWYLEKGWDFVADSFILDIYGGDILFSHIPKIDSGYMLNVHGHFHNTNYRKQEPELVAIKNKRQVLVALEYNNYRPITLKTLVEKNRP